MLTSFFFLIILVGAATSPAESADDFKLEMKMKGAIAFVPTRAEDGSENGAFALVVNATKTGVNNEKLSVHLAAIRVRTRNLFPAGTFGADKPFTIIPLEGEDISIANSCAAGAFKFDMASRAKVPKFARFAPDFAGVPAACVKLAKDVPKNRVLARYLINSGTLVFEQPITDSNGADIRWCFGTEAAKPPDFICADDKVQEPIAQGASVEFGCSGGNFKLTLTKYDGNSKREFIIYPDANMKVTVEIVNEMPEDVALPDVPSQVPGTSIEHFKWFYALSEKVPAQVQELYPFIGQKPEQDGKPFCSVAEMK